jgi:hypothetical protein
MAYQKHIPGPTATVKAQSHVVPPDSPGKQ